MAFNNYLVRISIRLVFIFMAMLALSLVLGRASRLFTVLAITLLLILLIAELFWTISRTNRLVQSLIESIRHGDYNRNVRDRSTGLGFSGLANAAQEIISAIAGAKIEKEKQYQMLKSILEHIHTPLLTLDEKGKVRLINPLALNTLGLHQLNYAGWKQICRVAPDFCACVESLGPDGRQVIRLNTTPGGKQLLVLVNSVRLGEERIRIVTFQDIEPEMEEKEMESWHTISRIMAHEIMNSLTPLSSLTETGIMMIEDQGRPRDISLLKQQSIDNLHQALHTISDRNAALCKFIGNYRKLARLPLPEPSKVRVAAMLEEIMELYREQIASRHIVMTLHPGPAGLHLEVDESQIKQVIINLLKNAIEALEDQEEGCIDLYVKRRLDNVLIEVRDNGPGISPEAREKIFVPFYTSKKEGSGIGLSLSRQIVRNHGGQISLESDPGGGSLFRIILPFIK